MPRERRTAIPVPTSTPQAISSIVVISNDGDILIQFKDPTLCTDRCYRCSRNVLRSASEYFNVLLDPIKFSEGIAVEARIQDLARRYNDFATIAAYELPRALVTDVGDLPMGCVSTDTVVALFFKILHDSSTTWPFQRAKSVPLLALLSIVADRFACTNIVADYLIQQKLTTALLKNGRSNTAYKSELKNRQKLLVGLIFGFPEWVQQCSASLIVGGPARQTAVGSEDEDLHGDHALWWRLPGGVEEELACRREYVLATLSSIPKYFLSLYISKQPQCRLGYDSSPQCDSYQLGEMIRFFSRKGIIRIESAFDYTPEDIQPLNGNLEDIIAKLKECPSYQIDNHHTHCGLRTQLLRVLEGPWSPRPRSQVGICLECWKDNKGRESWLENPIRGTWSIENGRMYGTSCREHLSTKAMYTAERRDWTPPS